MSVHDRLSNLRRRIVRPLPTLKGFFRESDYEFYDLRLSLKQSRMPVAYDAYLARITVYTAIATLVGIPLGIFLTFALSDAGVLETAVSPIGFGPFSGFVETNQLMLQGIFLTIITSAVLGAVTWGTLYYQPSLKAEMRRRSVNHTLPHAITYLYALTYGGMNILDAMKKLSESDDAYGEVAKDFDVIIRDMEFFGSELPSAVQNTRDTTPSENLNEFLDDLLGVMDSGGDIMTFLRTESDRYLERARNDQEDFLSTLTIMGEIYVTMFVAAPLLFIIILIIISLLGEITLPVIFTLVYVGLPVGITAFGIMIHTMSSPYGVGSGELYTHSFHESRVEGSSEEPEQDERFHSYMRTKRVSKIKKVLRDPFRTVKEKPPLVLFVTLPLALITVAWFIYTGAASTDAFSTEPVPTTTLLVAVPLLIAVVPLSILHEVKQMRIRDITRKYPDKLTSLANANKMGLPFTTALEQVSRRSKGVMANEFSKVHNDIIWNSNMSLALVKFANRLRIPQVSRSMKLIAETSRTTGELSKIIEVAATDTKNQYRLMRRRYQEMSSYIAIIIMSFLVYLSVIVVLDVAYLMPIAESIAEADVSPRVSGIPTPFVDVSISTYRMVFYHSVLIQAFGNGILAGKIGADDMLGGLKYSIAFVILAVVVFHVAV